ncbi:MAG: bifunctional DNA-formamidopyrimidine glycosylase/DNA-(apurinic or apyrimidinic site) lyase [bacterium]|nr:bifunctional DNA-formamidopyrimidine glycosylase/DNA-(apurinic or apyrimidinic site) lyase [bacterium]
MPELPEVESVGRALAAELLGRRLSGLRVRWGGVFEPSARAVRTALIDSRLVGLHRHGKYLIARFEGPAGEAAHLMIHLRMTGQFLSQPDYAPDRHVHVTFDFEGRVVHFRDVRKFGRLTLVEHPTAPAALAHVGPDMLTVRTADWLTRARNRAAPFKSVLLDQGVAAGLGNIYADESLFLAGVHPLARPRDLDEATLREVLRRAKQVLRLAIRHGGTTFLDFRNFHGQPGNFRRKLRVYGRAGEPCRDCGTAIERIVIGGRSSCWCPRCQPAPRP